MWSKSINKYFEGYPKGCPSSIFLKRGFCPGFPTRFWLIHCSEVALTFSVRPGLAHYLVPSQTFVSSKKEKSVTYNMTKRSLVAHILHRLVHLVRLQVQSIVL